MTEPQRKIFSKLLDANWEAKELREAGKFSEYVEKSKEVNELKKELQTSMGEDEYNKFIAIGQRMFAPA